MTTNGLSLSKRTVIGATLAALVSCLALLLVSSPPSSAAGGGCPNANADVDGLSKGQFRDSLTCLFNSERSAGNLAQNADLTDAAQKHTNIMRSKNCFKHECPGEPPLKKRVENSGYATGNNAKFGEIIAIGPDSASPSDFLNAWLGSSDHRGQIKKSAYDDVGVGVNVKGDTALVTAVFGSN